MRRLEKTFAFSHFSRVEYRADKSRQTRMIHAAGVSRILSGNKTWSERECARSTLSMRDKRLHGKYKERKLCARRIIVITHAAPRDARRNKRKRETRAARARARVTMQRHTRPSCSVYVHALRIHVYFSCFVSPAAVENYRVYPRARVHVKRDFFFTPESKGVPPTGFSTPAANALGYLRRYRIIGATYVTLTTPIYL